MQQWMDQLDWEYLLDVDELQREFAGVNRGSPEEIHSWLRARLWLTSNDLARICRVSLKTVQRWKRAASMPLARRRQPPGWQRPRPLLVAPPDWRAGSWLQEQYAAGHSIHTIARAVGLSYSAVRRLLLRRGVSLRTTREAVRSRHPCCSRGWLVLHYVVKELSLTACARLAGVSKYTLTAWLLQHQIRVRSVEEQMVLPYGGRKRAPRLPRTWSKPNP